LVIGGDRAGLVVDVGHALDHFDLEASAAEQRRRGRADRAVTDDCDVAAYVSPARPHAPLLLPRAGQSPFNGAVQEMRNILLFASVRRQPIWLDEFRGFPG